MRAGVRRFVLASTIKVHGEATVPGRPFRADDPLLPQDAYARSKADAERRLAAVAEGTSLDAIVLRLPLVYGPRVKGNFLTLLDAVARGARLPFGGIHNRRDLLYVGNLVHAVAALLDVPGSVGGAWLAADGEAVSTAELARRIASALGVDPRVTRCPGAAPRARRPGDGPRRVAAADGVVARSRCVAARPAHRAAVVHARPRTGRDRRLVAPAPRDLTCRSARGSIIRALSHRKPAMTARASGRRADELRPLRITRRYTKHAEGSVLIEAGDTKVLCTASVEEGVPPFLKGKGRGWLTAEYGMLPRATNTRGRREAADGKQSGRTQEIQRLVGRSLRSVADLSALGERTIKIDCDVLQADGGTRCASITGACVAVADAIAWCRERGLVAGNPLREFVAAVSVGVVDGTPVLDLDYAEDSACDTDMNVVMTAGGALRRSAGHRGGRAVHARGDGGADRARRTRNPRAHRGAEGGARCLTCASATAGPVLLFPRLVLASSNAGKLREFHRLLAPLGIEVIAQSALGIPEAEEPHGTFVENALAKARHASALAKLPALADDSGICVRALDGAPGVQSARYAGEPRSDARNNAKLIAALAGVADRRAHYACVLTLLRHDADPEPIVAEGAWHGTIVDAPRGTRRLRLRPALPRCVDRAHRRRASARTQERALASRQGDPRADRAPAQEAGDGIR